MKAAAVLALGLLLAAGSAKAQTARTRRRDPAPATRATPKKTLGQAPGRAGVWTGDAISLDLKDADLRDVLHGFAELTRVNIAVDPEVRGSVTVRLHDVPWDQALDLIVRANGFGYLREGNVMRVGAVSKLVAEP